MPAGNIFLGREKEKNTIFGNLVKSLDDKFMLDKSGEALESLHVEIPSLKAPIETLSGGQRQAVAIARAVTGTMTGIDGLGMLLFVVFELLGAAAAWALCRFGMLDPAGADTEACTPEKGPQAPKPLGLSAPKAGEQGKGVIADVGATPGVLDDCDTACIVATADSKDGEQRCRSLSVDLLGATTPSEPEVIKTRRNPSGVSPEGP